MIRPIVKDELFLAQKSEDANKEDASIIEDLIDTLRANIEECVGMAANMIGVKKRIIVFAAGELIVPMVNPVILKKQKRYEAEECCLSLTGFRKAIRYEEIEVEYLDANFNKQKQKFTGFVAQIIQHEIDHYNIVKLFYIQKRYLMNKKRNIIIAILLGLFILGSIVFVAIKVEKQPEIKEDIKKEETNEKVDSDIMDFLNAIAGVKAEELEIINNPIIGVKGKIFVPEESIVNGINYFLEKTKNNKMSNLEAVTEDNNISLYVNYAVTDKISTPIKVDISPNLNENKDLVINIGSVKILDLKLADFIVNLALKTFIKDWFVNSDIIVAYENNKVIISKENFNGIDLNSILVSDEGITLDMMIDANILQK